MPGPAGVGEQPGMDAGMQGLDPAFQALGKPVTSSTGVTGTPAAVIAAAVLPVLTICTPAAARAPASSASPVLS